MRRKCRAAHSDKAKEYRCNNQNKLREYNKQYKAQHKNDISEYGKVYYLTHKQEIGEYIKINKIKIKENRKIYRAKYYQNNKMELKEHAKYNHYKRLQSDPKYKLNTLISHSIRESIKGNKMGRPWELLVGYSIDDLMNHLEKQFIPGMVWENYGKWHIDHIIPISAFNFNKPEHIDFKRCWALNNLQPLWAKDNLTKHARIIIPFQPSLQMEVYPDA